MRCSFCKPNCMIRVHFRLYFHPSPSKNIFPCTTLISQRMSRTVKCGLKSPFPPPPFQTSSIQTKDTSNSEFRLSVRRQLQQNCASTENEQPPDAKRRALHVQEVLQYHISEKSFLVKTSRYPYFRCVGGVMLFMMQPTYGASLRRCVKVCITTFKAAGRLNHHSTAPLQKCRSRF